jgi:hypothetical protein
MERKRLPLLCPSSRMERPGAKVLGVLNADGRLDLLKEPRPVTPEFAAIAERGRDPHLRFRFSGPCSQSACPSWENGRCGIPDVVEGLERDPGPLPPCPIRPTCRWHQERGDDVCRVCPQVIHSLFAEAFENEPT